MKNTNPVNQPGNNDSRDSNNIDANAEMEISDEPYRKPTSFRKNKEIPDPKKPVKHQNTNEPQSGLNRSGTQNAHSASIDPNNTAMNTTVGPSEDPSLIDDTLGS